MWEYIQSNASWLTRLGYIVVLAVATIVVASLVNRAFNRSFKRLEASREKKHAKHAIMSKTRFTMVRRVTVSFIYLIGLLFIISAIPELRRFAVSLLAGAGILAVIIGFATQEVFANVLSGVFIMLFEPFRIDDRITIGPDSGFVEDITLWHTVIRNFEHQRLMIPNSIIAKEKVTNHTITDPREMNRIEFGISYDSDIDLARKIITEEALANPYFLDARDPHQLLASDEQVKVRVIAHGDFSITLRLYVWSKNSTEGFFLRTELLESVKKRFDAEGVEIPFPYRTIVEKKDLRKNKKLKK